MTVKNNKKRPPRTVCVFLHENVMSDVKIRENKSVSDFRKETFSKSSVICE